MFKNPSLNLPFSVCNLPKESRQHFYLFPWKCLLDHSVHQVYFSLSILLQALVLVNVCHQIKSSAFPPTSYNIYFIFLQGFMSNSIKDCESSTNNLFNPLQTFPNTLLKVYCKFQNLFHISGFCFSWTSLLVPKSTLFFCFYVTQITHKIQQPKTTNICYLTCL